MTTGPAPICLTGKCIYWTGNPPKGTMWGFACKAFPQGIPDKIIVEGDRHTKPLPGQGNSVVFTPKQR